MKRNRIPAGLVAAVGAFVMTAAVAEEGLSRDEAVAEIRAGIEAARAGEGSFDLPVELPEEVAANQAPEIFRGELEIGDKRMPYSILRKGTHNPEEPVNLYFCLHGGGKFPDAGGPHGSRANDREYAVQTRLAAGVYPGQGVFFVPRMADDRLGRWWHRHNQIAFDAVIDHAILHWNVSPDRVYLVGISEGGYGIGILAPWMGDRFAGANAMAAGVGLANPPANLRNLAFRTDVGEMDTVYERRPMAEAFHRELSRLQDADPGGYRHHLGVQKGRGHGIDYSQGIAWISGHVRRPWPERVVWVNQILDGGRRERFHWLSMPDVEGEDDLRIVATVDREKNRIVIEADRLDGRNTDDNRTHGMDDVAESGRTPLSGVRIDLLLSDELLDLDQPVLVSCNGGVVHEGTVPRSREVIRQAIASRPDPSACPVAILIIRIPGARD